MTGTKSLKFYFLAQMNIPQILWIGQLYMQKTDITHTGRHLLQENHQLLEEFRMMFMVTDFQSVFVDCIGMTTNSVHQYKLGIYEKLGLDETKVTKVQTGGPDGDLGSNEIMISK